MLQFAKMAIKIIHVSLGACLGPMPGMGMNYNHTGVLAWQQTLRISVFKCLYIQNSPGNHETWHGVTTWYI